MIRAFWKWLALFAYRRWAVPGDPKPVGVPGNRDPNNPCAFYEPRKWQIHDWNDCMTDGHYLCKECCHINPKRDEKIDGTYGRWIRITMVPPP